MNSTSNQAEKESVCTDEFQLLVEELPERTGAHNKNHTKRVLFLASMLAEEYGLSAEEKRILCGSAVYHDAGRKNDLVDPEHGWGGYLEYIGKFGPDDTAEFLIVFHCKHDSEAEKFLERKNLRIGNERARLLYKILKDADALDRIRFNGLDPKFLRLEKSHELTGIAAYMIELDRKNGGNKKLP